MSLIKELWLALIVVLLLCFSCSLVISVYSAQSLFEEQLYLKNIDNANSLAMTLSQEEKNDINLDLYMAAVFDNGHYKRIELFDPDGYTMVELKYDDSFEKTTTPPWFKSLVPIEVDAGVSQVSDGWSQYGTLYVESHTEYAQDALWRTAKTLFISFLIVALICGIAMTLLLKWILNPLKGVEEQARAMGDKRFMKLALPRTTELATVVAAMNQLVDRFKAIIQEGNKRLDELRYRTQHDELTGLANREYFFTMLDGQLNFRDTDGHNALFLFRLVDLMGINNTLGRLDTDELMKKLATTLVTFLENNEGRFTDSRVARLNGSDFAILVTEAEDLKELSEQLLNAHLALSKEYEERVKVVIVHSAVYLQGNESRPQVMIKLDKLMHTALESGDTCAEVDAHRFVESPFKTQEQWYSAITKALDGDIMLLEFPVVDKKSNIVHMQALNGLKLDGQVCKAGYFAHKARVLNLLPRIDTAFVRHISQRIDEENGHLGHAILLSIETIRDKQAVSDIRKVLLQNQKRAELYWFEVRESSVIAYPEEFQYFCQQMHDLGCHLGLKRVGDGFSKIQNIESLGLDYMKVDSAFVHNIAKNATNQGFIRGLCGMGHSVGMKVYADGANSPKDVDILFELGIDGVVSKLELITDGEQMSELKDD